MLLYKLVVESLLGNKTCGAGGPVSCDDRRVFFRQGNFVTCAACDG